jgi:hypothetical protein
MVGNRAFDFKCAAVTVTIRTCCASRSSSTQPEIVVPKTGTLAHEFEASVTASRFVDEKGQTAEGPQR